jgi:hypothetical protein
LVVSLILSYALWSCQETESENKAKPWVGKWTFIAYVDSGGATYPGKGVYHFYGDGTFTTQMIESLDRPNLTSSPSTLAEYEATFDQYRAGFGTYTVNEEEGSLIYEYTSNLRPHRVGKPTKVYFEFKDDTMTLNYKEAGFLLTFRRESGLGGQK